MPALGDEPPLTFDLLQWDAFDKLFLGDGDVSMNGLRHFTARTLQIVQDTHAGSRCIGDSDWRSVDGCDCGGVPCAHGSPAREAGKEDFSSLVRENMWLVTGATILYMLFVHCAPRFIEKPFPVKPLLSLWNLALAVFSAVGSYHCMGALLGNLQEHGFRYTVCQLPKKIDMQGYDLDIWVCFFVLSKVFEFVDTILKVLLRKPFIFLHWYHHAMTAWLGWLSLAYGASAGQWYAGLNFTVHAPMYTYYFIGSVIGKDAFVRYLRPIAPFITSIQIVQMAAYMYVNTMVWVYYYQDALPTPKVGEPVPAEWTHEGRCHIQPVNLYMNAFVTLTYLVLFSIFFFGRYVAPKATSKGSKKASPPAEAKKTARVVGAAPVAATEENVAKEDAGGEDGTMRRRSKRLSTKQ